MNLTRLHQCVLEIHLNQLNYSLQYHIQEYEQIESISGIPIFVLLLNIVNSIIKEGRIIANIPKIILCFSLIGNTPEKYSAIIGYDTYLENLNGGVSYKK